MEIIGIAGVWIIKALFGLAAIMCVIAFAFAPFQANPIPYPDKTPKDIPSPNPKKEKRPKKLYTAAEAMIVLDVSYKKLKKYILDGKIRTFLDGDDVLLHGEDVQGLVSKSSKKRKSSYPTVSSYNEEHRITNPVEFST